MVDVVTKSKPRAVDLTHEVELGESGVNSALLDSSLLDAESANAITTDTSETFEPTPVRVSVLTLVTIDIALGVLASTLAYSLILAANTAEKHISYLMFMVLFSTSFALFSQVIGLQNRRHLFKSWDLIFRSGLVVTFSLVLVSLIASLFLYEQIGRYVILLVSLSGLLGLVGSRIALSSFFATDGVKRVSFFGSPEFKSEMKRYVGQTSKSYDVVSTDDIDSDVCSWLAGNGIDELIFEDSSETSLSAVEMLKCINSGIRIHRISSFFEFNYMRVHLESLSPLWVLDSQANPSHATYFSFAKRALDVVCSLIGLVFLSPILIVVMVLIRLESSGPAIYSQTRVGQYGKPFTIYKLRSMRSDAEANGARFAVVNDDRVTKIGNFLRLTRFDEIPQLINVLAGDMSLVGPRPERPVFVDQLQNAIPYYSNRHSVKPGISGWAQINYSYGSTMTDARVKLSYDLYYVKYGDFWLDLQIILRTIGSMASGSR